jgi:hypothetical protein
MGRYYDGTISGKFWFTIQHSHDAANFKNPENFILPTEYYIYYECGCKVEDINTLYCTNCFSDYDTHLNGLDYIDKNAIDNKLLAYPFNYVLYEFDNSDLDYLTMKLNELENEIGKNIIDNLNYTINILNYFEYDINKSALDYLDESKLILVARWCLGKQIECAIINNNYCEINCEL